MKIAYIGLSLLIAGKLCASYFDVDAPLHIEIQKNRDTILSEHLSSGDELHPIVEEFRTRILASNEPIDFHQGKRISADTEFTEWYLIRPLFAYYVEDPAESNLSEFEDICERWICRTQIGILIKIATYEKLKRSSEALDLDWAARDLIFAAQTEYAYYEEALASPELIGVLAGEEFSQNEVEIIKRSESDDNRLYYERMIKSAGKRDFVEMRKIHRDAMRIKTADNNENLVFKAMWPNWPGLLNKIQPVRAGQPDNPPVKL